MGKNNNEGYPQIKRAVGLKELRELNEAIAGVGTELGRFATMAESALAVTGGALQAGDVDSALATSLTGVATLANTHDDPQFATAMARFEAAAEAFYGERKAAAESPLDFFGRVVAIKDPERITDLQRRNGIVLVA